MILLAKKVKVREMPDNKYYLSIDTKKCRYAQVYFKTDGSIEQLKNMFVKFYQPFEDNETHNNTSKV